MGRNPDHPGPTAAGALTPLREARLWVTFVWALTLALGVSGLDWAERLFEERAAALTMLLLPTEPPDASQRQAMLEKLRKEAGAGGLQWRAPADYSRQLSQRFAQPQWQGLFPEDEGWMPWILEVHPLRPLEQPQLIRDFIARREQ